MKLSALEKALGTIDPDFIKTHRAEMEVAVKLFFKGAVEAALKAIDARMNEQPQSKQAAKRLDALIGELEVTLDNLGELTHFCGGANLEMLDYMIDSIDDCLKKHGRRIDT